jgi:hypothetical protein
VANGFDKAPQTTLPMFKFLNQERCNGVQLQTHPNRNVQRWCYPAFCRTSRTVDLMTEQVQQPPRLELLGSPVTGTVTLMVRV